MMKPNHGMSIAKWSSRSLVMSIAAMLMAVTGLIHAGPMNVASAGGGAFRAWSVPYNPTSVGMVTGLQGFLRTETGVGLLAQAPSLGIISGLSPNSEAHRRIIGVLGLSADFEAQLQAAILTSDNKALTGALGTILSAYRSQNAEEKINEAIQVRSNEIAAAVSQGKMSVTELSAAALEVAPFASVSAKAKAVEEMASVARSANTMDVAQHIASAIMQNKGSVASEQAHAMAVTADTSLGQKDVPKGWQLQPASHKKTIDTGAEVDNGAHVAAIDVRANGAVAAIRRVPLRVPEAVLTEILGIPGVAKIKAATRKESIDWGDGEIYRVHGDVVYVYFKDQSSKDKAWNAGLIPARIEGRPAIARTMSDVERTVLSRRPQLRLENIARADVQEPNGLMARFNAWRTQWARDIIVKEKRRIGDSENAINTFRADIPLGKAYVKNILGRLTALARLSPKAPLAAYLVDSYRDYPQASMRAGVMRVARELILILDSEDEIAAVLAQQLAHLELDHDYKEILAQGRPLFKPKARDILDAGPGLSEKVLALKRQHVFDADARGLEILNAAGYDASAAVDALRKIEAKMWKDHAFVAENSAEARTFPAPAARLARMEAKLKDLGISTGARRSVGLDAAKEELAASFYHESSNRHKTGTINENLVEAALP